MIFNINSTRGQKRFLTCVARVTCLVRINRRGAIRLSRYVTLRLSVPSRGWHPVAAAGGERKTMRVINIQSGRDGFASF